MMKMIKFNLVVELLLRMIIWRSLSYEHRLEYISILYILQSLPKLGSLLFNHVYFNVYVMLGYTVFVCPLVSTLVYNSLVGPMFGLDIISGIILGMSIYAVGTMMIHLVKATLQLMVSDNTYTREKKASDTEENHVL